MKGGWQGDGGGIEQKKFTRKTADPGVTFIEGGKGVTKEGRLEREERPVSVNEVFHLQEVNKGSEIKFKDKEGLKLSVMGKGQEGDKADKGKQVIQMHIEGRAEEQRLDEIHNEHMIMEEKLGEMEIESGSHGQETDRPWLRELNINTIPERKIVQKEVENARKGTWKRISQGERRAVEQNLELDKENLGDLGVKRGRDIGDALEGHPLEGEEESVSKCPKREISSFNPMVEVTSHNWAQVDK